MLHFHIITIFPELFESRAGCTLFGKAKDKWLISLSYINPREFTTDRHQTVDDAIYGGWEWLLMKAKPIIDAVNHAIERIWTGDNGVSTTFKIIYPSPSTNYFNQQMAFDLSAQASQGQCNNIILVCGRYEGIDQRFEQYFVDRYPSDFLKVSLGKYVVYGGEVPSMMVMEAITRLLPWWTHKPPLDESYYPHIWDDTIENPHYTRPQEVYGYTIPDILLSGHHKRISQWRWDMME